MVNLQWNGDDFRNSQDSSGATANLISHQGKLQQGYQHGSLTRGLVAYYPMEKGEGEVLHDGALNNLGQINGATWNSSANFGNYSLNVNDENNEYAMIQDFSDWVNNGEGTIAYWVNISDLQNNGNGHPHVTYSANGGDDKYQLENKNGNIRFWIRVDANSQGAITMTASTNTWYFVVGTVSSGTYRLYINNELQGTANTNSLTDHTDGYLGIGSNITETRIADAKIKDVRVYNRSLSRPEITALYNQGNGRISGIEKTESKVPSQDQGGISRYKFNGDVADSWGNNAGTNNGATFNTGVYGQAADFDGSSNYIDLPSISQLSAYTLSMWAKGDTLTDGAQHRAYQNFDNNSIQLRNEGSGNMIFYHENNNGNFPSVSSKVEEGKWNLWTITWDGSKIHMYKNGKIVDSNAVSTYQSSSSSTHRLGADRSGGRLWDGKIDDVRIYNQALTPLQVEQLYHKGAYRIPRRSTLQ